VEDLRQHRIVIDPWEVAVLKIHGRPWAVFFGFEHRWTAAWGPVAEHVLGTIGSPTAHVIEAR
jgi:hypothetical protein